jgi:dihydroorotase-like cyclic amidohydrolase
MTADLVLKNGWVVTPEETVRGGVAISNGKFVAIGIDESLPEGKAVIDLAGKHIFSPASSMRTCISATRG